MSTHKTYISFVIQSEDRHVHDFSLIDLPSPIIAVYDDNTSQEVIKWSTEKQSTLPANKKIVVLNYFTVSNIK